MKDIRLIQGRLSNQMFILAAHLSWCWDNDIHFFVQDEKYFKRYEDRIRQLYGERIIPNSIDRVAIHRRLGKNPINPSEPAYSDNPFYVDLGHHEHQKLEDNYFVRAMSMFPPETKYTVFSDDIEKAKQEPMFQGEQFEFSEGRNEVEDLNYAACHKGIIGSNSSYSWWIAYLSGAEKIVFPKQWFSNPQDDQFIGLLPEWERI